MLERRVQEDSFKRVVERMATEACHILSGGGLYFPVQIHLHVFVLHALAGPSNALQPVPQAGLGEASRRLL